MKILLTGSKGFIGSYLSRYLKQKNIDYTALDTDLGDIYKEKISTDAVIHLAAKVSPNYFIKNPHNAFKSNIQILNSVLEFCRLNKAKIIFVSTCGVYLKQKKPVSEFDQINPVGPYSYSKYIAELLCQTYSRDFQLPVTILRLFNVYGFAQKEDFVIPYIFNCAFRNDKLNIKHPEELRDFIHVNDVCDAVYKSINRNNKIYEVFNVGSGQVHRIGDVVEKIYTLFGKNSGLVDRQDRVHEFICANLDLVKQNLNWHPQLSLDAGLKQIFSKYEKNL